VTELVQKISSLVLDPSYREVAILTLTVVLAVIVRLVFSRLVLRLTHRTKTTVDDQIVESFRRPLILVILLAGLGLTLHGLEMPELVRFASLGAIKTIAIVVISSAAMRISHVLLDALSRQVDRVSFIQPKTLPLLEIIAKVLIFGGGAYFVFLAWNIDVTTWLASAGIIGIAVGFAAKDTLANLFSGIFILADAPYQIGDFIILDNGLRGQVLEIGIRSTRILTRDDIEVTLPNAVIAGSKIVNETSGKDQKMRVRVQVSVAYGSDVDQVRRVLLECVEGVDNVEDTPSPRVRFRRFGDSGLDFELLAWVTEPVFRGRALDDLNTKVYKRFGEEGIEIPYPKLDLYVKEGGLPGGTMNDD
jgi:small-conductance mechanosensitive channel